jgi:hypothetical protein
VSSAERDDRRTRELIERLLIDPAFRAEFRRDPAAACVTAGMPELADDLAASSGSMDPLAARESRSSLAGVVMAVAVEGISVAEAQALMQHGLAGARTPGGGKLLHAGALRSPLGHVHHGASAAPLERELRRIPGASPAHAVAPAAHAQPAASTPSSPPGGPASPASPAGHDQPAASTPAASSAGHDQAAPSSPPAAPPAAPTPPEPGAQPAHGGVVPAWPDQHPGGGGADSAGGGLNQAAPPAGDPASALDSPQLSAPPDARAFLTGGGADPRLIAVLNSTLANHSIGLGQVTTVTDPVPMQVVSIVSVDGQPVGPSNFAARDLVTELAALDPSLRPSEIGTPWPIHAPGFFTDQAHQGQLHLAFLPESSGQAPATAPPTVATPEPAATPPAAATPEPAATAPPVSPEAAPATAPAAAGPYVNMLPDDAKIGRTDMGVDADLNPGEPITAPGTSRVLGIMPNWYQGQPYVALQLLDGPMKGHNYYVAEQITPAVSTGQIVQQGQPIGHYAASGTGIEMGWAGSNWEQTLAQSTSGYSEGQVTPAGASFHNFLEGLGHGGTQAGAGPPGAVPAAAETVPPGPDPDDPPPSAPTASPAAPAAPEATQPAPSTPPPAAPFSVLESRHHGPVRHTVQFLPAVQPSPGSPLYGHASDQIAAPQPSEPQAANAAPQAGAGQAAEQPAQASVLDQAPAPAPPTAGSISVSSSLLTPGQQKFAGRLAELTGLDPRVVAAWELAEESGGAAQGREAASNFNWLNIGYFDSGAGKIAFDKTFSDPVSAAEQSAKFLKGEWGGASPSIRAILNSVTHRPDEQMAAIANSDWASSHYGGGANLHGTYDELADIRIEKNSVT